MLSKIGFLQTQTQSFPQKYVVWGIKFSPVKLWWTQILKFTLKLIPSVITLNVGVVYLETTKYWWYLVLNPESFCLF